MQKSYALEGGPPPVAWDDYSRLVEADWKALLDSQKGGTEKNIQHFLEMHPCLVPGGQSMSGPSGHSAYPAALISQPRLPGFGERVPDFLWLASDSLHLYAVLIEIESPAKRMFTKAGLPTADFTQAQTQLAQWKAWLSSPENQALFRKHYCPNDSFPWRRFLPQYVLIYGRRAELRDRPQLNQIRAQMSRENEFYMTFDRLHPINDHDQYMTVRFNGISYEAVSLPPTLELGPFLAEYRSLITGKEQVVDKTPYLPEERKQFLKRRFAYWDEWGRNEKKGAMNAGDWE
jgi:hypothetical protein